MDDSKFATKDDMRDIMRGISEDFKQYLTAELSATATTLKNELKTELKTELLEALNKRFAAQDEKLDEILNAVGEDLQRNSVRVDDHESRITRLEHKAA